jgi:hypothetical protein
VLNAEDIPDVRLYELTAAKDRSIIAKLSPSQLSLVHNKALNASQLPKSKILKIKTLEDYPTSN